MTRSELKQLIRETIEEYKSGDADFWQNAAEKARDASTQRGGRNLAARSDRFDTHATNASMKSTNAPKTFTIQFSKEGKIEFEGKIKITKVRRNTNGSFQIFFEKEDGSTKDAENSKIIIESKSYYNAYKDIGKVFDGKGRYEFKRNEVRLDRMGIIALSKLSGIPASAFLLI